MTKAAQFRTGLQHSATEIDTSTPRRATASRFLIDTDIDARAEGVSDFTRSWR